MDYNTEVINSAARQLAEMVKEMVIRQQERGQGALSIAQIEMAMCGR